MNTFILILMNKVMNLITLIREKFLKQELYQVNKKNKKVLDSTQIFLLKKYTTDQF